MIEVIVRNPGNEDDFLKALAKFKKLCNRAGFLREIRDRRYYKKPSEKRIEKEKYLKRQAMLQKTKKKKLY